MPWTVVDRQLLEGRSPSASSTRARSARRRPRSRVEQRGSASGAAPPATSRGEAVDQRLRLAGPRAAQDEQRAAAVARRPRCARRWGGRA